MSSPFRISDDLARQIRERRDELSLSQREAADRLGVSERTVQNWEAGTSFPWPKHRRALTQFLSNEEAA